MSSQLNRSTIEFGGKHLPDIIADILTGEVRKAYPVDLAYEVKNSTLTYSNVLYLAVEELSAVREEIESKDVASRLSKEDQGNFLTIKELEDLNDALTTPATTALGLTKRQNILNAGVSIMNKAAFLLSGQEDEKCKALSSALMDMTCNYADVLTALEGAKEKITFSFSGGLAIRVILLDSRAYA